MLAVEPTYNHTECYLPDWQKILLQDNMNNKSEQRYKEDKYFSRLTVNGRHGEQLHII